MNEELAGILRHALTSAGGGLVAAGYLTNGQLNEFVTDGVGIVMMLGGVAWSIYQKRQQKQALATATAKTGTP